MALELGVFDITVNSYAECMHQFLWIQMRASLLTPTV